MEMRSEIPLLSFSDIYTLLTHNLGLRLTDRLDEVNTGGIGDAIPLSGLGDAKQSIHFVTLCALLLWHDIDESTQTQYKQELSKIFKNFADPDTDNVTCVPSLILTYARLIKLEHTNSTPTEDYRLPKTEETFLLDIYEKSGGVLSLDLIFDQNSHYYADLPSLRLHLSNDFNQLLQRRLIINCRSYYTNDVMYYMLLTATQSPTRFTAGYDFARYPLGKTGRAGFLPTDVIAYLNASTDIAPILTWLKQQCGAIKNSVKQPTCQDSKSSSEYKNKKNAVKQQPTYLEQCSQYVWENKGYMVALIGGGLFAATAASFLYRQAQAEDAPAPQFTL